MTPTNVGRRPSRAGFSVIAEFEVKPERFDDFIILALRFSEECIESEDGCWQFDVIQLESSPLGVLFFEAYDGMTAFEVHCQSDHLARFRAAYGEMVVAERPLRRGSRCHDAMPRHLAN